MMDAAEKQTKSNYAVIGNSCANTPIAALEAGGFLSGLLNTTLSIYPAPKVRFNITRNELKNEDVSGQLVPEEKSNTKNP